MAEVAERIIGALSKPFNLSGHQVVTSPSIGIVLYPENGVTAEDLIKAADSAMYHSKRLGGSRYHFFSDEMTDKANIRLNTETALREAIAEQADIIVHYQPQVDLKTGEMDGLEALARWQKDGQLVPPPNDFIPLAEETGLSTEYIEFELTEARVVENVDYALSAMTQLKARGISLALDDFGTGHSSLSYLKQFPMDILKIDKSFVDDMERDNTNKQIVKTIIELAHHLGLKVIAEGVESRSQLEILKAIGCDSMQGYFYKKPMNHDDTTALFVKPSSLSNVAVA